MYDLTRVYRAAAFVLVAASAAFGQSTSDPSLPNDRPIRWRVVKQSGVTLSQNQPFNITVSAAIAEHWKLYSLTQPSGGPAPTTIKVLPPFQLAGTIKAPKHDEYPDRNFNIFSEIYEDSAGFVIPIQPVGDTAARTSKLRIVIAFQTCTDRYCLPPRTETLSVKLGLNGRSDDQETSGSSASRRARGGTAPATIERARTLNDPVAFIPPADLASLARFIWLAVTMGLLSLLTPCILPMVPITIGFFCNAVTPRHRIASAVAHAGGIVVAFLTLGLLVSALFGAGGVMRLAANPWLNLGIAILFIAFALNLLGAFEIALPSRVLTRITSASPQSTATAAALMGGVFAVTSFTCTIPFIGTLLVLATQGTWRWPIVGIGAYALAFAFPFLLLGISPSLMRRLPKPGAWMVTLKRALGLLELAMAAKFLSNTDLVLQLNVLTRTTVLLVWIAAMSGVLILLLSAALRGETTRTFGGKLFTTVSAAVVLVVALWMGTGLRGGRLGELDAYLPPPSSSAASRGQDGAWRLNDLDGALREARVTKKNVLVDFTGYTCTNCRWMEANMFPQRDVDDILKNYILVRLFTDGMGEPYGSQQRFQQSRFGTVALPYYAVLRSDSTAASTFLGMTRDREEFMSFLRQGLEPGTGNRVSLTFSNKP